MSWQTMSAELVGQVSGLEFPYALTLVNRAWREVQRSFMWSFLYDLWPIPTINPIVAGTVTVGPAGTTVVGDATAAAAWQAVSAVTPLGSLQFRIGTGTIYDIINFDGNSTLTLGKPFVDPGFGSGLGYQILSVYFNAPVQDFVWFESLTDPVTGYSLSIDVLRTYADDVDPQRLEPGWPQAAIPYGINNYSGTSYFGRPRIELWPVPSVGYTYVGSYFRSGADFSSLSDTVNPVLGEDIVMERAKYWAYEWKIANASQAQMVGGRARTIFPNTGLSYLMSQADKKYQGLLNEYQIKDENFSKRYLIDKIDMAFVSQLPWVSQKTMQARFP